MSSVKQIEPVLADHGPRDHRFVEGEELKALPYYDLYMTGSTLFHYANAFTKAPSKWTEHHLIAFRAFSLEGLPPSRIVAHSDLPTDDNAAMKLVNDHLMMSEQEVRAGVYQTNLASPTSLFYECLQTVIQRPTTPPDHSIPIPRSVRPSSRSVTYPSIPESHGSTSTDSSFRASPPAARLVNPPSPMRGVEFTARNSTDSASSKDSKESGNSIDEDKLEQATNHLARNFLSLLCMFFNTAEARSDVSMSFG